MGIVADDVKAGVEQAFVNSTLDLQQPAFELDAAAQERCNNLIVEASVVVHAGRRCAAHWPPSVVESAESRAARVPPHDLGVPAASRHYPASRAPPAPPP